MQLNPYGQDPVLLAAALANDPPADLASLVARCAAAGLVMDMPATEADLVTTRALVERWCDIVDAPDDATRARLLNALLVEAAAHPRLSDHAGTGWHLHYREDGVALGTVLRALVSVGTALHLTTRGMGRLGRCTAADCTRIYADVSRNGMQRYCSPRCSTRDAVRRHRARSVARPARTTRAESPRREPA